MIVDCHTHVWESPHQLGRIADSARAAVPRPAGAEPERNNGIDANVERHLASAEPVDKTIVLGFKSHYLGADIPNAYVADYVRSHPDKLIGFAGIDPSRAVEARDEMKRARETLGLKGVAIAPAAQDVHPTSTEAMKVYARAADLAMPILFHHGLHFSRESKMEYARPVLLDEVAREFPDLKLVIAHMGDPWAEETVVLLGKHEHVYANISGLLEHPFHAYLALLSAYQNGVMEKLLFGSDFPYTSAAACIESLYSINQFCHGTNLPTIPRERLRGIVERDALTLLGIPTAPSPKPSTPHALVDDDL